VKVTLITVATGATSVLVRDVEEEAVVLMLRMAGR
jgi:hypothetical protein